MRRIRIIAIKIVQIILLIIMLGIIVLCLPFATLFAMLVLVCFIFPTGEDKKSTIR